MPVIQIMRLIILFLLLVVLTSCHASRQSSTDYSTVSSTVIEENSSFHSTNDLLSIISTSHELNLLGIRIEFYPPDSLHPYSRAAPKSLSIDSAKAKDSTEQVTHEQTTTDEQKTENLSAQTSEQLQQDSTADSGALYLSSALLIPIALILFSLYLIKNSK